MERMEAPARRVVLGVTGSIAAYKAAEIIRLFRKEGIEVHVVMTPSAGEFITPMTLGTLSGNPVTVDLFSTETGGPYMEWGEEKTGGGIRHIQASRAAELIVVAPATGNLLGKVAAGIADEPLSTAILASSVKVLFAPAMNTMMWENAAVRANVRTLRSRGYEFVDPIEGDLACGEFGRGKMADPMVIVDRAIKLMGPGRPGLPPVLVTAGGTQEPLDPVRVLANRSSGKMGFAVAAEARRLGFPVTLVHGAVSAPPPLGVTRIEVSTAEEMLGVCKRLSKDHPVLVMAAAVADYRPGTVRRTKIEGGRSGMELKLTANPDLLATLAPARKGMTTVGFALETTDGRPRARAKMVRKGCDLMVLNNPLRPGSEFGSDTNEVVFLYPDGREEEFPVMEKSQIAREILYRIAGRESTRAKGVGGRTAIRKAKGIGKTKGGRPATGRTRDAK
jgi:phosphopantothenoylcysteine decarboxylase / phosphopantothenate---cysteine ligase